MDCILRTAAAAIGIHDIWFNAARCVGKGELCNINTGVYFGQSLSSSIGYNLYVVGQSIVSIPVAGNLFDLYFAANAWWVFASVVRVLGWQRYARRRVLPRAGIAAAALFAQLWMKNRTWAALTGVIYSLAALELNTANIDTFG